MDQIQHKLVEAPQQQGGLKLHIAEIGAGPNVVVLLHGFPEIWYSWRHQLVALAHAGFRAIAPDYRGYGLSDPPPEPEKASYLDFVNDIIAIVDFFGIPKVFVIGKDFGCPIANYLALLYPHRIRGIVTMGVPYIPKGVPILHKSLPEGFYMYRWREPGRAEADFGRLDPKTVFRNIYILFSGSEIPIASEGQEIMDLVDSSSAHIPHWLTEEDVEAYGASYEKSGFRTALQVPYRSRGEEFEIDDLVIKHPALFIMGREDYVLKIPGIEEYLNSGKIKEFVPNLEVVFLANGSHFVQEQSPREVNELILNFLASHV